MYTSWTFTGAVAVRYSQTSYSSTGVSQVNCTGTEGSITNCPRTTMSSTCSSSRDAGVYCQELNGNCFLQLFVDTGSVQLAFKCMFFIKFNTEFDA